MERVEDDGYIEMLTLDASKSVQNLASLEKYRKLTFDARVLSNMSRENFRRK